MPAPVVAPRPLRRRGAGGVPVVIGGAALPGAVKARAIASDVTGFSTGTAPAKGSG